MADAAEKLVTVEEFLRFDGESDRRYELFGGAIIMMSPPARLHGMMVSRLVRALGNRLSPPCEPQTEAGIRLPWSRLDYFQADLAVSCSQPSPDQWCPDPVLIVEVLSPSTEQIDHTVKLRAYRRLASVRHILLVSTEEPSIEHYARTGRFWRLADLGPGDTIALEALGVEILVDELYAGFPLPQAEP